VAGLLGILKCLGEERPEVADKGASVVRYDGVLDRTKFVGFLGGDWGGSIVTSGGKKAESGRGRNCLVGDGERFAEPILGGRSPPISPSPLSLPLPARRPSPNGTPSCRPDSGLAGSLGLLGMPFPVGCGERALGPRLLFGFALPRSFDICSKCERREETGF
jgi:hypothetical protein